MRFLLITLLSWAAQDTSTNKFFVFAHSHNHDSDGGRENEQRRNLRIHPVHTDIGDYASFEEFAKSDEFHEQNARCSQRQPTEEEVKLSNGEFKKWIDKHPCTEVGADIINPLCTNLEGRRRMAGIVAKQIQVYFHVITKANGMGSPTEDMLEDSIDVLNNAFHPDFTFVWDKDTGVDTTSNDDWYHGNQESNMKTALHIGDCSDLNIYTLQPGANLLGWATFPWECKSGNRMDGVVMLHETLPGGNSAPYNLGNTLVHETGHWLGLFHTFEGGCNTVDGEVSDTPPEKSPAFGCPTGRDSCERGGKDPVNNYMDYTDDACMDSFTIQQFARMLTMWEDHRDVDEVELGASAFQCGEGDEKVEIVIETDDYGEETTWKLMNQCTGEEVSNGGPYGPTTVYHTQECLHEGDYLFEITDAIGDGMCCDFGKGFYKLIHNDAIIKETHTIISSMFATDSVQFGSCPDQRKSKAQSKWNVIFSDNFDDDGGNWGNWNADGRFAKRHKSKIYHSAINSIFIGDDGTNQSSLKTDPIDVSSLGWLQIKFWFYFLHFESDDGYVLEYSSDGGSEWTISSEWQKNNDYENNEWNEEEKIIDVEDVDEIRLRFRCVSDVLRRKVFFDDIDIFGKAT